MEHVLETWLRASVLAGAKEAVGEQAEDIPDGEVTIRQVRPGDRILDYRILALIGRGGFGEVYRAEHELLRRIVAIKIPHDVGALPALRRSARIQGILDDRGIVRTLEASLRHDPPYVVFEHVDGPSLAELIHRAGPLPWTRALPLLRQIAGSLHHAHEHGFIHGDVKPANVLIEGEAEREQARLTDFGSTSGSHEEEARKAWGLSSSVVLDSRSEVAGTPPYIAPEVVRGEPVDERADVYGFGVLLFEVLTGHVPEGRDLPSDLVPGIPRELDAAFDRCFARRERRAQRFAEIQALFDRAERRRQCRANVRARKPLLAGGLDRRPSGHREVDVPRMAAILAAAALTLILMLVTTH